MSMYLRYTVGSPFARSVRVVLHEKGLQYERAEEITTTSAEDRARDAPTLQVPAFRDGDLVLWDSLVIIEYLMTRYPGNHASGSETPFAQTLYRPASEQQDRLVLATLQTLGVSVATVSQLKWTGIGLENAFARRQADRLDYLLDWLEDCLGDDGAFWPGETSVQDVCLAVWLDFIDNRPIDLSWRSKSRPRSQRLNERMKARDSFRANPVWYWEPGVTGYLEDGTPLYD